MYALIVWRLALSSCGVLRAPPWAMRPARSPAPCPPPPIGWRRDPSNSSSSFPALMHHDSDGFSRVEPCESPFSWRQSARSAGVRLRQMGLSWAMRLWQACVGGTGRHDGETLCAPHVGAGRTAAVCCWVLWLKLWVGCCCCKIASCPQVDRWCAVLLRRCHTDGCRARLCAFTSSWTAQISRCSCPPLPQKVHLTMRASRLLRVACDSRGHLLSVLFLCFHALEACAVGVEFRDSS